MQPNLAAVFFLTYFTYLYYHFFFCWILFISYHVSNPILQKELEKVSGWFWKQTEPAKFMVEKIFGMRPTMAELHMGFSVFQSRAFL